MTPKDHRNALVVLVKTLWRPPKLGEVASRLPDTLPDALHGGAHKREHDKPETRRMKAQLQLYYPLESGGQ